MRIIKQGKLIKQVKCDYCKCEFEYDSLDIKEEEKIVGFAGTSCCSSVSIPMKYVRCPECNNKIEVKIKR